MDNERIQVNVAKDDLWLTKQGALPINEMSNDHIIGAIRTCLRRQDKYQKMQAKAVAIEDMLVMELQRRGITQTVIDHSRVFYKKEVEE